MNSKTKRSRLDMDWVELIKRAKRKGLTQVEVRNYLNKKKAVNKFLFVSIFVVPLTNFML